MRKLKEDMDMIKGLIIIIVSLAYIPLFLAACLMGLDQYASAIPFLCIAGIIVLLAAFFVKKEHDMYVKYCELINRRKRLTGSSESIL